MANLKSSQKDARRTQRRTVRNVTLRSRLKTLRKKVEGLAAQKGAGVAEAAREYISALDKAAKSHVVHPNKVARQKSQMCRIAKI